MEGRKATTAIFIDRYHPKAGGLCAVSIRVTHDRKKKYYPTPVCLTISDFEKVQGPKLRNEFKELALNGYFGPKFTTYFGAYFTSVSVQSLPDCSHGEFIISV